MRPFSKVMALPRLPRFIGEEKSVNTQNFSLTFRYFSKYSVDWLQIFLSIPGVRLSTAGRK